MRRHVIPAREGGTATRVSHSKHLRAASSSSGSLCITRRGLCDPLSAPGSCLDHRLFALPGLPTITAVPRIRALQIALAALSRSRALSSTEEVSQRCTRQGWSSALAARPRLLQLDV